MAAIQDKTIDQALIECMRTMKALQNLRGARKLGSANWQHARAKRASLDLTRVLADLRQGR